MAVTLGRAVEEATTRAELVEWLAQRFEDPSYVQALLERLDERQRRALEAARAGGGEVRGFLLARLLGSTEPEAAQPLLERGLLFRTFAAIGPHRGEVFTAPDEVLAQLGAAEGEIAPRSSVLPPPCDPPPRDLRRASDPIFNTFALASFLQRHAGTRGEPAAGAEVAAFRDEVSGWVQEPGGWPWQERWAFFRHTALAARLLVPRGQGRTVAAGDLPVRLADRPGAGLSLWQAYARDREWSELRRAGIPHGEELADQVDSPALREAVFRALARLPVGVWMELSELLRWLEGATPTFLREQLDTRSAALVDPRSGAPLLGPGSWERVEGVLLRYLLLGPLYWLGALGADARGERVVLTTAGGALLGRAGSPPMRPVERCEWTEEGQLVAPARANLGALLRAERYLVLESRAPPCRYRLERERIVEALAGGGSIAELRECLAVLLGGELPAAVAGQLRAWENRFGAVSLRPAVLLEARSAAELDAVQTLKEVAPLIRRRLGDEVAEVPASHAVEVAEALGRAGHLPRVDAALRLMAGRRAYAALVDEHVLEFLLVSLLAFRDVRPDQLAQLEGALGLLERLEGLFPPERREALQAAAESLAGELRAPGRRPRARPIGRRRAR